MDSESTRNINDLKQSLLEFEDHVVHYKGMLAACEKEVASLKMQIETETQLKIWRQKHLDHKRKYPEFYMQQEEEKRNREERMKKFKLPDYKWDADHFNLVFSDFSKFDKIFKNFFEFIFRAIKNINLVS